MLAGKRAVRVGDQILREIAELLIEKVKDPRVKGATMTGIRLGDDLKHCRVYYSVMGGEAEIVRAQTGLDRAKGFIKRMIGARLELKYMPEITFEHDPSLEKGQSMEKLLMELKSEESPDACD